jgi:ABC-type lipoprotein export system ATPase subunit
MAEPVVALDRVSKSYRQQAGSPTVVLHDVTLTIQQGDKVSLVGPSGSGKSTLLSLIAGLLRPDEGVVSVDGVATESLPDHERAALRARRIGIALQSDNLIPFLTAQENVELALSFGRLTRRARTARARDLLGRFGVADRAHHRPRHLSGGEAQRVSLAVALANDPAILLADEVVGQLDVDTATHVLDEVLAANHAVLYVTHDLELADRATRRYRLRDHRIESR